MTMYKKHNGVVTLRAGKTPDHSFIPSADIMMESVCNIFGKNTLGALMTGMGDDGARSMCFIKKAADTQLPNQKRLLLFTVCRERLLREGVRMLFCLATALPER